MGNRLAVSFPDRQDAEDANDQGDPHACIVLARAPAGACSRGSPPRRGGAEDAKDRVDTNAGVVLARARFVRVPEVRRQGAAGD